MSDGREGGRIDIHRRLWSSPDLSGLRAAHLFVFITILRLANWKPGHFWVGKHRIDVARGELAHSLKTIAEESRATVREVRTTIDNLLRRGVLEVVGTRSNFGPSDPLNGKIDTQGDTGIRVLRVVNYDGYQPKAPDADTGGDKLPTGDRHGSDTAPTPIESLESLESRESQGSLLSGATRAGTKAGTRKRQEASPEARDKRAAWERLFLAQRGEEYRWGGPPDQNAANALAPVALAVFEAKALRGLTGIGFNRCSTLAQLKAKWNDLAGPSPVNGVPKPTVTAAAPPQSKHVGGDIAL